MIHLSLEKQKAIAGGAKDNQEIRHIKKNWFGDDVVQLGPQTYTIPSEERTTLEFLGYAIVPGLLTFAAFWAISRR